MIKATGHAGAADGPPVTPSPRTRLPLLIALGAGLAVGVLTFGGQVIPGWLDRHVSHDVVTRAVSSFIGQESNSGAVWSMLAFALVAALPVVRWRAALAGFIVLLAAAGGYYAAVTVFLHDNPGLGLRSSLVWGAVAVVAGPVFGLAGSVWRRGAPRWRPWGLTAPGALFVVEGGYDAVVLRYFGDAAVSVAVGFLVVVLLARTGAERRSALLRMLPCIAVLAAAFAGAVLVVTVGFTL
jgi:hypothetical protein